MVVSLCGKAEEQIGASPPLEVRHPLNNPEEPVGRVLV